MSIKTLRPGKVVKRKPIKTIEQIIAGEIERDYLEENGMDHGDEEADVQFQGSDSGGSYDIGIGGDWGEDFNYECSQLPFCCGWYELGAFQLDNDDNITISDELRGKLLSKAIIKTMDENEWSAKGRKKMFITTIVPRQMPSRVFEFAIIATKRFKHVATFDNHTGSRGLKTYISI